MCKFIWFLLEMYISNMQEEADCHFPKAVQEQLVEHYCRVYEGAYEMLITFKNEFLEHFLNKNNV